MAKDTSQQKEHWSPPVVDGVETNKCRNACCANFGVPAHSSSKAKKASGVNEGYIRVGVGVGRRQNVGLKCQGCGEIMTMLSNAAVVEELKRFNLRSVSADILSCGNDNCVNHRHDVNTYPEHYQQFGKTNAGSPRWRCRECLSTFSSSAKGSHRLRQPEKSEEVLRLLVNKVPMRRMCEVANIRPKLLYNRITRLAAQCRAFADHYEEQFLRNAHLQRLHLNVDRQTHMLNWGSALERMPISLQAIATADVSSGYILAQHLNYDPDANPRALELLARAAGDPETKPAFRQYARLWLPHESMNEGNAPGTQSDADLRVPGVGGIVHEIYTMAAHLHWIQRWVSRTDYVQFSLDQDPGLERLCLGVFADRVRLGTLDAFLVRIDKNMTVPQRKMALAETEMALQELRKVHVGSTDSEIIRLVIRDRWLSTKEQSLPRNRAWITHPYPTMTEPRRQVLALTDNGARPDLQIVSGLSRASLRGVDRYFMQVRRKVNILERPLQTASSGFRTWYGYNAYSPRVVMETLEIFRTVYNFHLRGQDHKTPAQRLGILDRAVSLEELCANSPASYSLPSGRK